MMPEPELMVNLIARLAAIGAHVNALDDRVRVLEEVTISHESRLEDLEEEGDADTE
jgi:hypothetical protein